MNAVDYVILAYVVGLGLLLGDGVVLWARGRALSRRERCKGGAS